MNLPFEYCGIIKNSISQDNMYGLSYILADGRCIKCPVSGGVWLNDIQVSGICDKSYNDIIKTLELYMKK